MTNDRGGSARTPLLSIAMIVKDEIRCLARCFDSLEALRAAIPCELVVADTGSTDGTRELARERADLCFDFTWADDFAAARNAALDRCSGRWALILDADEALDADLTQLLEFLASGDAQAWSAGYLTVRNYVMGELYGGDYVDSAILRLANLAHGVRFTGRIHEHLSAPPEKVIKLARTILHHDGYSAEQLESKDKRRRNMALLRAEAEREPNNLLRVLQCIESSETQREKLAFCAHGLKLVREDGPDAAFVGPAVYVHAVRLWAGGEREDTQTLIREAFARFPDSPLTQVDVNYHAARYYAQGERFEDALAHCEAYERALARTDADEFSAAQLPGSVVTARLGTRAELALVRLQACVELGRMEAAAQAFDCLIDRVQDGEQVRRMCELLVRMWRECDCDVRPALVRWWEQLQAQEETAEGAARLTAFFDAAGEALCPVGEEQEGRDAAQLFAALGEGSEVGLWALLCTARDAAGRSAAAAKLEKWAQVPQGVLATAVRGGADFPDGFYAQPLEELRAAAYKLRRAGKTPWELALCWGTREMEIETPEQMMWDFQVVSAALQWEGEPEIGREELEALSDWFASSAEGCLELFCSPLLQTDEFAHLMPAALRFGRDYLAAVQARESGEMGEYLRLLRVGIHDVPIMKGFVQALLRRAQEEARARQVQEFPPEMAEMVVALRKKIAQMRAAGDPALGELLRSPIYQQLRHLIEEDPRHLPM